MYLFLKKYLVCKKEITWLQSGVTSQRYEVPLREQLVRYIIVGGLPRIRDYLNIYIKRDLINQIKRKRKQDDIVGSIGTIDSVFANRGISNIYFYNKIDPSLLILLCYITIQLIKLPFPLVAWILPRTRTDCSDLDSSKSFTLKKTLLLVGSPIVYIQYINIDIEDDNVRTISFISGNGIE